MIGLILFILSTFLAGVIYPIGFLYSVALTLVKSGYKTLDEYLFNCALATDQHANVFLAKLFNDIMIKTNGHKFGNPDETISSVLGKNKLIGKLSLFGKCLDYLLHLLDNNHSIKSIETDENPITKNNTNNSNDDKVRR
jgi:8-oxo-dGTP diphosphatase